MLFSTISWLRRSVLWLYSSRHMSSMSILSSAARNPTLINFLWAVQLPTLCSTTFSYRLFIDKFYALQNGPPNSPSRLTTLRNDLVPSRTPFVPRHRQHPHFYLNWMAAQPTVVNILVNRNVLRYLPVASATSGTCPMS